MSIENQEILSNDSEPVIAAPNEKHLACVLLLDTSGSMAGTSIQELNQAVKLFKEKVVLDEMAKRTVDISIVTFNSTVKVVQPFVPVMEMDSVHLEADGSTAMGQGIVTAVELIKQRNRLYAELGTPAYKPWIFLVSDGEPSDDMTQAITLVKKEEQKGKLKMIALGVQGYSKKVFSSFTNRILELKDYNFEAIFDWLAKSMVVVSVSKVDSKGEDDLQLPDLPDNSRIVPRGW
jgi:uncharacterized protein YegL